MKARRIGGLILACAIAAAAATVVCASEIDGTIDQKNVLSEYAGSASCQECHKEEYADWSRSHHALAERAVDSNAVARLGANFKLTVDRELGVDPLIQFLMPTNGGRWQAFDVALDAHSHERFNVFGDENRHPGEWGHWTGRGMNWNSMCAYCHNTRLLKNYDAGTDSYHTTMAEMGVGCEACHGPLAEHVRWQRANGKSTGKDPGLPHMTRTQRIEACGACHSRRSELTGDFKPGDPFQDHFELAMLDATDTYYPDGQVHEEDYEYSSFLSSKMFASGVECADCHQPHSGKTRLPGNFLCLRCHNGSYTNAPIIDPVAHSHHRVRGYTADGKLVDSELAHFADDGFAETGGECVNCHMPQTIYMQRHKRHDHGFTIPDPLLTKQAGVPNACNRCHRDKDADWAMAAVDKWYGKRMDRPSRQRALLLAKGRRGDAEAVEPLVKWLAMETNSYWKVAVINVLQPWSSTPEVVAALQQNLNDPSALIREKSARALDNGVENLTDTTVSALRASLADPVRSVRVAAAWDLRARLDTNSEAGRALKLFLDVGADQPGGQLEIGEFLLARGENEEALEHYRKAVAWDLESAPIRHDLAVLLSSLNKNREAVEQLQEVVRLEPNESEYHFSLALALNDAGEEEKSLAELQKTVRLNPKHSGAWRNLGLALAKKNELDGALDALAHAEKLEPNNPRIPYARATVLARLGRAREARLAAERALELNPADTAAQELLRNLSSQKARTP